MANVSPLLSAGFCFLFPFSLQGFCFFVSLSASCLCGVARRLCGVARRGFVSLSASCLCGVARSLQLMPAATAVSMQSFLDERPTAVVCQSFACHASHVGRFVWVDPGKSRKGSFCSGVGLLFGLGLLGEAPQFSQWPAEAPHQRFRKALWACRLWR